MLSTLADRATLPADLTHQRARVNSCDQRDFRNGFRIVVMIRYERVLELPSPAGKIELRIQQGGAGRFYFILKLPTVPDSNEITLSVPSELADSLTHAIGKAADYSGE